MTFFEKEDGRQGFLEILNTEKTLSWVLNDKWLSLYLLLIPISAAQCVKIFLASRYAWYSRAGFGLLHGYLLLLIVYYILVTGPVNCSRLMMPFHGLFIVMAVAELSRIKTAKDLT